MSVELLRDVELKYAMLFSQCMGRDNYQIFFDKFLPDMIAHNFITIDDTMETEFFKRFVENETNFAQMNGTSEFLSIEHHRKDWLNIKELKGRVFQCDYMIHHCGLTDSSDVNIHLELASRDNYDDCILFDMNQFENIAEKQFHKRKMLRRKDIYFNNDLNHYIIRDSENSSIIGECDLFFSQEIAKIEDLYILNYYRKQGYGSAILSSLKAICFEKGITICYLITDSDDSAKNFYKKNGFSKVGEKYIHLSVF